MANEFFIAEKLHVTVAWLRQNMSEEEFVGWGKYFAVKAQSQELENAAAAARMKR